VSGAARAATLAGVALAAGDCLFTYPNFDPVAVTIGHLFGLGPIAIRWYGIMYLVGFALGWLGARWRGNQPGSRV